MAETSVDDRHLEPLRGTFRGKVIAPGQEQYDEARTLFNSMVDKRPAVIAQCADADDVVHALGVRPSRPAWRSRSAGEGTASPGRRSSTTAWSSTCARMNAVTSTRTRAPPRVGGGATMSHLDRATEPFGLATTGGRVSTTGVGGFTLGGGTGWLDRKFGLACDNLLSVDLVHGGRRACCGRARTRTPSCSGRCTAAAATSASRPRSRSGCTRCPRHDGGAHGLAGRARARGRCARYRDVIESGARRASAAGHLPDRRRRRSSSRRTWSSG